MYGVGFVDLDTPSRRREVNIPYKIPFPFIPFNSQTISYLQHQRQR